MQLQSEASAIPHYLSINWRCCVAALPCRAVAVELCVAVSLLSVSSQSIAVEHRWLYYSVISYVLSVHLYVKACHSVTSCLAISNSK